MLNRLAQSLLGGESQATSNRALGYSKKMKMTRKWEEEEVLPSNTKLSGEGRTLLLIVREKLSNLLRSMCQ